MSQVNRVLEGSSFDSLAYLINCEEGRIKLDARAGLYDGALEKFNHFIGDKKTYSRVVRSRIVNDGEPAVWPIDYREVMACPDMNVLGLDTVRTLAHSDRRHYRIKVFSKYMVSCVFSDLSWDGTIRLFDDSAYSLVSGVWVRADGKPTSEIDQRRIPERFGSALADRYEWSVWVGHGDSPRLRFRSDPRGAMEVFRFRDIPDGRQRRAALLNWVRGHKRRTSGNQLNEADATWVRRHMRGVQDFMWGGFRCRIAPPAYDMEHLYAEGLASQAG